MRLLPLAPGLALAAAVLAGCGSGSSDSAAPATPTHDQADVTFATDMAEHHQQALQMVALTAGRPLDADFSSLAQQIKAAQTPEIDEMTGWLKDWGEAVPASTTMGDMGSMSGMSGMDGMSMDPSASAGMGALDPATMPGMMSDQEMTQLADASDAAFEKTWLKLMIEHHQGALAMAKTELADGEYPQALALAQNITDTQSQEISQMQAMLQAAR